MPIIKIEKVISFSSEDSTHIANNVLSNDSSKKWKCHTQGEKSASIVVQLEKASLISSIDIGNENSAYIEVLVTRSSSNDDYKVLLVMSSFMSPLEARQGTNINKVRMFTKEQLSKPECDEKWDRVKIVCTQPFNRHVLYGLSFITFHSPGDRESLSLTPSLTKFAVRPDSPNNLLAGSLFARRKEVQESTPLKAAAAIREASSLETKSPINQKKFKFCPTPLSEEKKKIECVTSATRNRNELLYSKDDEEPNKKIDYVVEQKAKETKEKKEKSETIKNKIDKKESHNDKPKIKQKIMPVKAEASTSKVTSSSKRKLNVSGDTPKKKLKPSKLCKPFNQLLDGVVLVISGIQNPDRGILRAKAMSMGAKYKANWDNTCTHLICAFRNTPKFNQVKGKGKIVTKQWVIDCDSERKRLPWRRYALDKDDKAKNESEEEIEESKTSTTKNSVASTSKIDNGSDIETETVTKKPSEKTNGRNVSDTEDDLDLREINKSDVDTEDEIERIQKLQSNKEIDIFNLDTDEEDFTIQSHTNGNPSLPDFFTDKTFYIDPNLSKKQIALLVKYITAFNGIIKEDLNGSIDIIISSTDCLPQLNLSSKTDVVSPDFVWECHNSQSLIPIDNFKL